MRSLLYRLEEYTLATYRMIALSATLGSDENSYRRWLRPDDPNRVSIVTDETGEKTILFRIHSYLDDWLDDGDEETDEEEQPSKQPTLPLLVHDLYNHFAGLKSLIFANRKDQVENLADKLNEYADMQGRPREFRVHHGSLSQEIREQTEEELKSGRLLTTLCSSTLELGIDIGGIKSVGQIEPTWSVNSLVQRLGRSGRRDEEPAIMRLYLRLEKPTAQSSLVDRLHPTLLQAIAIAELMLEKWREPPSQALDLSTLVQQVLSVLAETGGIKANDLYDRLVRRGAFRSVEAATFRKTLALVGKT